MEKSEGTPSLFTFDEYGRVNIEDKELLELISGAGDFLETFNADRCNNGCGSNRACSNKGC